MNQKNFKRLLFICFSLFPFALQAKEEIRDIYFEIHNDDIKSLVERKISLKKFENFYCEVYWMKDHKEIVVKADDLEKQVKEKIKEMCQRKSEIVIPVSYERYLAPFEKAGQKSEWEIYKDSTGVNSVNEVWVKKTPLKESFIEKRPTGTTKLFYVYKKVDGMKLLKEVDVTSYEGTQNISTKTRIHYSRVDGKFLLPSKAQVASTQNLVKKGLGDYTRKLNETFYFKNYEINSSKALIFFSKR